ncbi:glycosyltransferase [Acidipila sp. EB88]|uniref:glycosyltransferase n=1 Tax=Acidipila sp. EB88 TaxID=2305226 RepID=UPI000F5F4569|nr:glycosyltransferase [Acidipila sp. EB88]RRA47949.1 glycosyltransferase family 1 protein [Acidipila sp. EB88]
MPPRIPRVAFFPDSFHEVNGVAHTARQFTAWAGRTDRPFLCVRAGDCSTPQLDTSSHGQLEVLELPRGPASFALDKDLRYDPLFPRHGATILRALKRFQPDVIHITGPSELGMLGAALAHHLGVPLAASWHTNVHEYAARRSTWATRVLPMRRQAGAARAIERTALGAAALFYRSARLLFAPNPALCALLEARTGRPCRLMTRGIDARLFSPDRRTAPPATPGQGFTLGYVGRLSVEKNVALLGTVARELAGRAQQNRQVPVRFLIVGQGSEEASLRATLPGAHFAGVLRGEALAAAFADMDCFLFPSHTDTFGNVVLEALASGVPAVVTPDGGPAHIVTASDGAGLIATDAAFASSVADLLNRWSLDPAMHASMRARARAYAATASWDAVFSGVYQAYDEVLFHATNASGGPR